MSIKAAQRIAATERKRVPVAAHSVVSVSAINNNKRVAVMFASGELRPLYSQ